MFKMVYSQDSLYFVFEKKIPLPENSIWEIDYLNNFYFGTKQKIEKIDYNGNTLFSQSIKSTGKISEMDVKNPFKIHLFSEEQQSITFLDNTLSVQSQINLNDFQVNYITHISSSNQVDKCWIFDQQDSQFKLLSNYKNRDISLKNLSALLSIKNVYSISEIQNHLFIADSLTGIFEFDLYGSLVQHFEIQKTNCFDIYNNNLIILHNDKISIYSLNSTDKNLKKSFDLPKKKIVKFKIQDNNIFFESENFIYVYKLIW